jgi:uncharacterized protein (DUF608 family)
MPFASSLAREHLPRSGPCLGGIGTGGFEIRADGAFHQWTVANNTPLFTGPAFPYPGHSSLFFLLRVRVPGELPKLKLLQIEPAHGAAAIDGTEHHYLLPWLDGVDKITLRAEFPFVRLDYVCDDLPLDLSLEAFSPFIPHDAEDSALPGVCFDFRVRSRASVPIECSLLATARNLSGFDVAARHHAIRLVQSATARGCELGALHLPPQHVTAGTVALICADPAARVYRGWEHVHPYYERVLRDRDLPEVDDTAGRNFTDPATGAPSCLPRCFSTVGTPARDLAPGAECSVRFVYAWHFPHLPALPTTERGRVAAGYLETDSVASGAREPLRIEGHRYATRFSDASAVAAYLLDNYARLHGDSRAFVHALSAGTPDSAIVDLVAAQCNTFRTSCWFTAAGDFGVMEGMGPTESFAGLGTVDVALYGGVAAVLLFPPLDRSFVRSHARRQSPTGTIVHSHRLNFGAAHPREASGKRADLNAQFTLMALRAAARADDRALLRELWPHCTRALEDSLRRHDHDGDGVPDMAGIMCSYDNFPMWGVAPYLATQWIAATSAAARAAELLDDAPAATRWSEAAALARAALRSACWNGEYLRLSAGRPGKAPADEGCLSDQLVGQWFAHQLDLPPVLPEAERHTALRAVWKRNFFPDQGLRNCTWPGQSVLPEVAPDCWVDQGNTVWTGVELGFACLLLYEGMVDEGLALARHVEARYRRWGMAWNHQEFGGHYFRAMAGVGLLDARAGLRAWFGEWTIAPPKPRPEERYLVCGPEGYGQLLVGGDVSDLRLHWLSGRLSARRLRLGVHELGAVDLSAGAFCGSSK